MVASCINRPINYQQYHSSLKPANSTLHTVNLAIVKLKSSELDVRLGLQSEKHPITCGSSSSES